MFKADAIGASIVNEAIVASYCGLDVLAIATISYKVNLDYDSEKDHPDHDEIIKNSQKYSNKLYDLIKSFINTIGLDENQNLI